MLFPIESDESIFPDAAIESVNFKIGSDPLNSSLRTNRFVAANASELKNEPEDSSINDTLKELAARSALLTIWLESTKVEDPENRRERVNECEAMSRSLTSSDLDVSNRDAGRETVEAKRSVTEKRLVPRKSFDLENFLVH
jgi:Leucine-rich repeat (LRR) protein